MKSLFQNTAILGILSLCFGWAGAQEKVELKQKWIGGKTYAQKMVMVQTTQVDFGGQKQVTQMDLTNESTTAVGNPLENGSKLVTITYDRIKMKQSMGEAVMLDYDSDKAGNQDANMAPLAAMKGATIKVTVDKKDEVQKVEGMAEIIKNAGPGGAMLEMMFGDEQIKSLLKQFGLMAASGKPVGPGDSWPAKVEQEMGGLGKMIIEGVYSFKKIEELDGKPCALLDFKGKISMKPGDEGGPELLQGMDMKITNGDMTSTTHFDPEEGIARKAKSATVMNIEMGGQGQKIKMPITQEITLTVKEK